MSYQKKKLRRKKGKIKKTILFIIESKRMKHTRINLTKEVKNLYFENCKMLMKEIEYNTSRKIYCAHNLEEYC